MSNFDSGNFDPSKINRSQFNHQKKGQQGAGEADGATDQGAAQVDHSQPVDPNDVLKFLSAGSTQSRADVDNAAMTRRMANFLSNYTEDDFMSDLNAAKSQFSSEFGGLLTGDALDHAASMCVADKRFGVPVIDLNAV